MNVLNTTYLCFVFERRLIVALIPTNCWYFISLCIVVLKSSCCMHLLIVFYPKWGIVPPTIDCCVDNWLWFKGWDATIGIKSQKHKDKVTREVSRLKIMDGTDEEVWNRIFCELIKASPQNHWCNRHLTLFFHPPPAFDVYERPRGSDRVEVGHGEGGGRCHDAGEGQHEVSPCRMSAKSLVSYSKIHELRWNLPMLSTRMSPTWCAKWIYIKLSFGREIRRWLEASDMVEMLWCFC
jgi:hypothetical protein